MPITIHGVRLGNVAHTSSLFYTEGTNDKTYRVVIYECATMRSVNSDAYDAYALVTHWGRRGSAVSEGQSNVVIVSSDVTSLMRPASDLLRDKIGKGYTHRTSGQIGTGILMEAVWAFEVVNPAFLSDDRSAPIATVSNWSLPEIMGGDWHRDDFTESMLPVGYRPLLRDELPMQGDEILTTPPDRWAPQSGDQLRARANPAQCHQRTSRMLPSHVRYVREVVLWRLPNPPAGHQWQHAGRWTQDMLPAGYRPLLLDEVDQRGDEAMSKGRWQSLITYGAHVQDGDWLMRRTKRPLPDGLTPARGFSPEDITPKKRRRALEL
jgi:hypothetical protein